MENPIYVTQPALPPLSEFSKYLEKIWEKKIITNNGIYHKELELKLAEFLGVRHLSLFSNGTLALMTALQSLRITGEVITTPFSFVATTHSLWWNNIKPVFVDIENESLNLDPYKIEAAITPRTTAIMPVHVYGNPCQVEKIQNIADIYGLKIIYDAAHAFHVKLNKQSILNFGDLSVLSFHATKVYNTIEGGAIVCHDEKSKQRIDYLKNFGFVNETTVIQPGINAKMNEIQAAYGLIQLNYVENNIQKRKEITRLYKELLSNVQGIQLINEQLNVIYNYAYFPILINRQTFGKSRDDVYNKLKQHKIFCRRYFFPLISQFPTYRGLPSANKENLPVAEKIAQEVLCLPIYPDLDLDIVKKIVSLIITND